jgi:imipenem/basic amino acid-specific outer membrane pore
MRRYLALSVVASTLLMAGGDIAPVEPVVEAVEEESVGTFSGQFRAFYIDRTYSPAGATGNRNSLTVGGWIGYDTAEWNGLSLGVKAYGVEGLRIHDMAATNDPGFRSYDPSLYGGGGENYAFFGEAYLNYNGENTSLKIGRQKLNTPLAGADDARMLPNLFEAAVGSYTGFSNTTLVLGHVTRETVGTFGNVYGDPTTSSLAINSGYGRGYQAATSGNFKTMGEVALGGNTDTSGVTVGAVVYKNEGLSLQAWDYYAWDILNALYLSADYGWKVGDTVALKASAQYINQTDVGDNLVTDLGASGVDSNYWAAKLGASAGALSGYVAYSATGDSDGSATNGGIITPWGGMPAYTQGMVTRHMFLADTKTWKVAGTYKFNELLGANVKATAYYCSFDVGAGNGYSTGDAWTAKEAGFDIQYQATKDLNLRLRANYPTDFSATGTGWDEYRLIANYSF